MKKAHLLFLALACVMALSGCSVPKKPFRELTGAEIRSASVRLSPPDLTVLIQDTDRLAELLQDVTLYEADPSYTEYAGQAAAFTLELDDGTQTTVTAFSPFLILDGVGYRTKHGPCEALNRYANDLLAEDGAPLLLTEPPLPVHCWEPTPGSGSPPAVRGRAPHRTAPTRWTAGSSSCPWRPGRRPPRSGSRQSPTPSWTSAVGATPTGLTPMRRRSPARSMAAPSS